jgi:hypothetical protein
LPVVCSAGLPIDFASACSEMCPPVARCARAPTGCPGQHCRSHSPKGSKSQPKRAQVTAKGPSHNPEGSSHSPKGPKSQPKSGPSHSPKGPSHNPEGSSHSPKGPKSQPKRAQVTAQTGPSHSPKGPSHNPEGSSHSPKDPVPQELVSRNMKPRNALPGHLGGWPCIARPSQAMP